MAKPSREARQKISLARFLRPHLRSVILAPSLMAMEVACDLLQPYWLSRIVDVGIRNGDFAFALKTGGFMVATALLGFVGGAGCTWFAAHASQNFGADLREELFKVCLRLPFAKQAKLPSSTLINRLLNDVTQVQNIILIMLRILVRAPLLVIGGVTLVILADPGLAARILWPLPILAGLLAWQLSRSFPLFEKVQDGLDGMGRVVRENLAAVRVVKALDRAPEEISRFEKANRALVEWGIRANRAVGGALPLVQLLLNLSMVALIWFGGLRASEGMPLGKLMAIINYLTQILFSLIMSAMMLMTAARGRVSAARIKEVLAVGGAQRSPGPAGRSSGPRHEKAGAALEFRSVDFRYPGSVGSSLTGISFTLESGATLGILGSTGAGKSTLLGLILGLYGPGEAGASDEAGPGRILADGVDMRDMDKQAWRERLGWVPQSPSIFSGTVRENIRWGAAEATEEDIVRAAAAAKIDTFIQGLPQGYDTMLGQRGVNLSGGQRQRLSIARALVRRPALLLLDDAASALDPETEAALRRNLASALPGSTRIMVAQRIQSVAACDRILVLEDGKPAGWGTHESLSRGNAVYREIARSQGLELPA